MGVVLVLNNASHNFTHLTTPHYSPGVITFTGGETTSKFPPDAPAPFQQRGPPLHHLALLLPLPPPAVQQAGYAQGGEEEEEEEVEVEHVTDDKR